MPPMPKVVSGISEGATKISLCNNSLKSHGFDPNRLIHTSRRKTSTVHANFSTKSAHHVKSLDVSPVERSAFCSRSDTDSPCGLAPFLVQNCVNRLDSITDVRSRTVVYFGPKCIGSAVPM